MDVCCVTSSYAWESASDADVYVCMLCLPEVLLNCVKMFLCSFWVLGTIYRMYVMVMCSAQRNKKGKEEKM